MKRLGIIVLALVLCAPLFADETCDQALAEGKALYRSGKYKQAKEMFDFVVSECGGSYGAAATWSNKCKTALNPDPKTTTTAKTTTPPKATTPKPSASEATAKVDTHVTLSYYSNNKNFYLKGDTTRRAEPGAEGITYLQERLSEVKRAKTGALSSKGKGIFVFGVNGYYQSHIPREFTDTIRAINKRRETIIDVAMSNDMRYYCVVYDKNRYFANGPVAFQNKLKEFSDANEEFSSVSINDAGEYAIVTNKHYVCSKSSIQDFARAIHQEHGYIYSINISNKGVAICTDDGVYFENLPPEVYHTMERALDLSNPFFIKVVKFTDAGTCLVTDGKSQYTYRL